MQSRLLLVILLFLLAGFALAARLFVIQVVKGAEFSKAAVIQRSLRLVYATGRGQILDRHGKSLLGTLWEPVLVSFEPMLDNETRQALAVKGEGKRSSTHIIADQAVIASLQRENTAGLVPAQLEIRYGTSLLAPHITGDIQKDEIVRERPPFRELIYTARSGLELYFDDYLAARRPSTLAAVVDAQSRLISGLGFRDWSDDNPRRPFDVVTTINSSMQAATERIGEKHLTRGAIVVLEPKTGDILAMASFPNDLLTEAYTGVSHSRFEEIKSHPDMPFINRAIRSYAPGSVFKVVLAAAALDTGLADVPFICEGSIEVGDRRVSCFEGRAHGEVDLKRALAVSCNAYFINLGQRLGRETVLAFADRFALGEAAGITLHGEKAGRMPSLEEIPFLGDLANTSIGQGLVETTPLQLGRLMTIVANQGRDIKPRLVSRIVDNKGDTIRYFPVQPGTRVLSADTTRRLTELMIEVTVTGTAHEAGKSYFTAAGKSGTAQTGTNYNYTWFAGFAPVNENPLVMVVFSETKEKGNKTPTIFRELMEAILPLR
jgi:cell division protein FtsI/penicillin-binding protein 2